MKSIKNFEDLRSHLYMTGIRKRVAVVWAEDLSTKQAVARALDEGFIEAIFVGNTASLRKIPLLRVYSKRVTYVETETSDEAIETAIRLVREGKADIIMKGLVNTDNLLRAVLDKEKGILPRGRVMTQISMAQIHGYPRILFFTDPAVIPYPTQAQREAQVTYLVKLCHRFGIPQPRIALIHCTEKTNARIFPHTEGYADIIEKGKQGIFGRCVIDGPLDVKTACSAESLLTKGIVSPLKGKANALVFPDIESANAFYKTITLFAHAETACTMHGPLAPIVLPSRSDNAFSKFNSLALACL